MKVAGIVAEYNPFHAGHQYHIAQTKAQADAVVVVMSGSFVQRGLPAVTDKWQRAEAALAGGADLVCELPAVFAVSGAETFAAGAVNILNALHVDTLSFGSESADAAALTAVAKLLVDEPDDFCGVLRQTLSGGAGFAAARTAAVEKILGKDAAALLKRPNDILAVEYLKAIIRQNSPMKPRAIRRVGAGHDTLSKDAFPAARAIRRQLYERPDSAYRKLIDRFDHFIMAKLLTADLSDLRSLPDVSEGMEFALKNALKTAQDTADVINAVSSKRTPKSRVRRALCAFALNLDGATCATLQKAPPYLRVLGFNNIGQKLLKRYKKAAALPIVNNLVTNRTKLSAVQRAVLEQDIRATDLRDYLETGHVTHQDFLKHPLIYN